MIEYLEPPSQDLGANLMISLYVNDTPSTDSRRGLTISEADEVTLLVLWRRLV